MGGQEGKREGKRARGRARGQEAGQAAKREGRRQGPVHTSALPTHAQAPLGRQTWDELSPVFETHVTVKLGRKAKECEIVLERISLPM